jgi:hypothetical protein
MAIDANRLPHLPRENDERTAVGEYRRDLNRVLAEWMREYAARQMQSYAPAGDGPPSASVIPPQRDGFVTLYFDRTAKQLYVYTAADGWIASAAFT